MSLPLAGCPSVRPKTLSRTKISYPGFERRWFCRRVLLPESLRALRAKMGV